MFELLEKVANGHNSQKVFKIEGKTVMATDLINSLLFTNMPTEGIDCFVAADAFMPVWKEMKAPSLVQTGQKITVSEGKLSVDVSTSEVQQYALSADMALEGTEIEPKDFIESLQRVSPVLKNEGFLAFVLGGYIYASDGAIVLRTKTEIDFGKENISASKSFIDLLKQLKQAPTKIVVSEKSLVVKFDTGWFQTARYAAEPPIDFTKLFEDFDKRAFKALPDDVVANIKTVCGFSKAPDDTVFFNPNGVIFAVEKNKSKIDAPGLFPDVKLRPSQLKTALQLATEFDFSEKRVVAFKGANIEGFLSTIA